MASYGAKMCASMFTKRLGWGGGRVCPFTSHWPCGPAMPCMRFSGFEIGLYVCGERERKGSSSCDVGGVVSFTSRHGNGQGREKYAPSSSRVKDRGRLQNSVLFPSEQTVFRSTNSKEITSKLYFDIFYCWSFSILKWQNNVY